MKALLLILLLSSPALAAPIVVDDAHVQAGMDEMLGWVLANFIGKELALSKKFDEVIRARYFVIKKGDEFDVPGLVFSESIFHYKDPFVLTLEVLEGGRTMRTLKMTVKLQQVKKPEGNQPVYDWSQTHVTTHYWTQSATFELGNAEPIQLAKMMAKQICRWTIKQQHVIDGSVEIR